MDKIDKISHIVASDGSTKVEHSPRHPKAESLSLAIATYDGREKQRKKGQRLALLFVKKNVHNYFRKFISLCLSLPVTSSLGPVL